MGKNLKEKAINIKGKQYVLVSDRVLYFNEVYPNGCIQTVKLESTDRVEFKAIVIPDVKNPTRVFTGHSQAVWGEGYINKTAALENAETSAVGRALALMGIGVIDSIASVDEINKAQAQELKTDPELEKPPVCSICGQVGIKAKTKTGRIFFTCPEWETHKQENETFKMVAQKEPLDEASQQFANSLH
jgi:hypothetical protein